MALGLKLLDWSLHNTFSLTRQDRITIVSSSDQLDLDLHWATSLASCLGFLFNYTPLTLYRLFVNSGKKDWLMTIMCFFILGSGSRSRMQMKEFSFLGQMQTGNFSFGVRIGVEDAKSLDLLHDFSLSVQTCLSFFVCFFFCVQADAFCTWRNAVAKAGREKKSPEIAKLTTQSIVFFKKLFVCCTPIMYNLDG